MVRTCAARGNFSLANAAASYRANLRTSARAKFDARRSPPSPVLADDRDLRIRPEFLVVAISLFDILVVAFEQRHARVEMKLNKFGQPNFIIHSGQLDENPRAFVDPDAAFELAEDPGVALLGFVAGTWFAFQHPGIASVENFRAGQAEVERVGDLQNELAIIFATFFFALHTFA